MFSVNVRAIISGSANFIKDAPIPEEWDVYDFTEDSDGDAVLRCDTYVENIQADSQEEAIEIAKNDAPSLGFTEADPLNIELWVD
jgi:hypothetical protein